MCPEVALRFVLVVVVTAAIGCAEAVGSDGSVFADGVSDVDVAAAAQQVTQIAADSARACAVRGDGTVWCWGETFMYPIGIAPTPTRVPGITNATKVSVGVDFVAALLRDGSAVAWGDNDHCQLGQPMSGPQDMPAPILRVLGAIDLATGGSTGCMIDMRRSVYCWGNNSSRIFIPEPMITCVAGPAPMSNLPNGIAEIALGGGHGCALQESGTVLCWGSNEQGELGDGTRTSRLDARPVPGLSGIQHISADYLGTCASDGRVRCWGTTIPVPPPDGNVRESPGPPMLSDVVNLSGGRHFGCAVVRTGSVWCWGYNALGQLGDGTRTTRFDDPVQVVGIDDAIQVATGDSFACALRRGGSVYCWGSNNRGALGDGTTIDHGIPAPVRFP